MNFGGATVLVLRNVTAPTSPRRNRELFGSNWSRYYFMQDLLNGDSGSFIMINATDALVDPYSPLRFGLQNAFDGDPATSFVANAEGTFMDIRFDVTLDHTISRVAIINGYAKSAELYEANI